MRVMESPTAVALLATAALLGSVRPINADVVAIVEVYLGESGNVRSPGEAFCRGANGSRVECTLSGAHKIATQSRDYITTTFTDQSPEYVHTVFYSPQASISLCYHGELSARRNLLESTQATSPDYVCNTPEPPGGGGAGGGPLVPPDLPPVCTGCPTPIVVDLDGGGVDLCGLGDPVSFDLAASGNPQIVSWTARNTADGFLALDRNGNGMIDDGRELFGDRTPLPEGGEALNGFLALAAFDALAQGGNADGVIDEVDAVFDDLVVWVDANHDGRTDPGELLSLREAGVTRIGLSYRESRRRDEHGNQLRYVGTAWKARPHGPPRRTQVVDVIFRAAD